MDTYEWDMAFGHLSEQEQQAARLLFPSDHPDFDCEDGYWGIGVEVASRCSDHPPGRFICRNAKRLRSGKTPWLVWEIDLAVTWVRARWDAHSYETGPDCLTTQTSIVEGSVRAVNKLEYAEMEIAARWQNLQPWNQPKPGALDKLFGAEEPDGNDDELFTD